MYKIPSTAAPGILCQRKYVRPQQNEEIEATATHSFAARTRAHEDNGIGILMRGKEIDNGPRCLFVFVSWINCLYSHTFSAYHIFAGQDKCDNYQAGLSNSLCEVPPRPFFCEYVVSGGARHDILTHFSGVGWPSQREAGENWKALIIR